MVRSKWLLLLLIPLLMGFDTRNPFRTRGPFKATDFVIGSGNLASCTPGVDCYCDCVTNSTLGAASACTSKWGSNIYDSSLIFCEDAEAPTLWDFASHESQVGDGAPYYGPAYDSTGWGSGGTQNAGLFRGFNSYWTRVYGNANTQGAWTDGKPAAPTYGPICNPTTSSGDTCSYEIILGDSNPWQANTNTAVLRIIQDGDGPFIGTITGGHSTNGDVFSGNASWEGIQQTGRSGAHFGDKNFADATEIGVTVATYWSSNTVASGVLNHAVKGWEFSDSSFSGYGEWITGGRQESSCAGAARAPYAGLLWYATGATFADFSGATVTTGEICDNTTALVVKASTWTRPSDFFGKWFCLRYHLSGLGTSNVSIQVYDPATNDSTKIVNVSGLNGAKLKNQAYDHLEIEAYNNAGVVDQVEDASQGFDNVHVRRGEPVSCAQIGF